MPAPMSHRSRCGDGTSAKAGSRTNSRLVQLPVMLKGGIGQARDLRKDDRIGAGLTLDGKRLEVGEGLLDIGVLGEEAGHPLGLAAHMLENGEPAAAEPAPTEFFSQPRQWWCGRWSAR